MCDGARTGRERDVTETDQEPTADDAQCRLRPPGGERHGSHDAAQQNRRPPEAPKEGIITHGRRCLLDESIRRSIDVEDARYQSEEEKQQEQPR